MWFWRGKGRERKGNEGKEGKGIEGGELTGSRNIQRA